MIETERGHTQMPPAPSRNNALYFPYISVPKRPWTTKTLLYWNTVSSIVPSPYIDEPQELEPYMKELVEAGLVHQLQPAPLVRQLPAFSERFIDLVERRLMRRAADRPNFRSLSPNVLATGTTNIHMEKLGEIPFFLMERGLAKPSGAWLAVDTEVANLFMAYLASCLAATAEVDAVPVTDRLAYGTLSHGLQPSSRAAESVHHQKAREVVLSKLLPVPGQAVTVDQLLRFKGDHGRLLGRFRRYIEVGCIRISREVDPQLRAYLTTEFIESCEQHVAEITDAMRPTWHRIVFGSFMPIFGAGVAWQTTPTANTAIFAGAGLSFAAAAYQAMQGLRAKSVVTQRPLAYVAFARSRLK